MEGLVACGPWLQFSLRRKLWLTLTYWLPWAIHACWRSRHVWWRYLLSVAFRREPVTFGDYWRSSDPEDQKERLSNSEIWYLTLGGRGKWLWWEPTEQVEEKRDTITYPVDWDGKGPGWYPFW